MTDTVQIILGLALLLLVAFSILLILQLWRVAKSVSLTLQTLNQDLPVIMQNVKEITTHINRTTTTVHRQVEDLSATLQKIQGMLNLIFGIEEIFRKNVCLSFTRNLRTSAAIVKGVRVFLDHLIKKQQ